MKVIVDKKIPYLQGVIERLADEVVYAEGRDFTPELVRDADALFVRTRTRCDRALLAGSRVRFIATATIGFDHIDTDFCRASGITWTNAPGCNAGGVEQYVEAALLLLERERGFSLRGACLGVVGVGHVGSRVADVGRRLGMTVLCCDPPRAEAEGPEGFTSLEELVSRSDLITFHTPLTREGAHPTWHLADEAFFRSLSRPLYLINTSRGEVVDNAALLSAFRSKVQNVVTGPDELLVVFHHNDRVSGIHQPVQQDEKMRHILRMQPSGGFVQQIQAAPGGSLQEFSRQLQTLAFPFRKRGKGLAQREIIQSHVCKQP